jgi:hypothetical protein
MTYRTPPANTKWQKGQSGNPSGRPADKHVRTAIRELFASTAINKQGNTMDASNLEVLIRSLLIKSVKGDMRATELLFSYGYGKPNQALDINDITEEKTQNVSLDLSGLDIETLLKIVNSEKKL